MVIDTAVLYHDLYFIHEMDRLEYNEDHLHYIVDGLLDEKIDYLNSIGYKANQEQEIKIRQNIWNEYKNMYICSKGNWLRLFLN